MKASLSLPMALPLLIPLLANCARVAEQNKTSGRPAQAPAAASTMSTSDATPDPYLWLEDVTGEKALDWVRQQNAVSTQELTASPLFEPTRRRLLEILDSKERIPMVSKHGRFLYNFWRDQDHVRGLWRRTTLEEYRKASPA